MEQFGTTMRAQKKLKKLVNLISVQVLIQQKFI